MRLSRALLVILVASALSCGAGNSTSPPGGHEKPGVIGLNLTLQGGQTLNALTYNLANGTLADALTGTIPLPTGSTSAGTYAVPTFEILPVVAATGYTITLSGTSTNGAVTCSGASAPPFAVTAGNETIVNVLVTCTTPNDGGSVEVNVDLQNCPTVSTLTAINATAITAAPGNTSTIWASAVGPNPGSLTYTFSVTQGAGTVSLASQVTAANDSSSNILFTCPATPEVDTIQVVTTDQAGAVCPSSLSTATVTVTCTPPPCQGPVVGTGIEAIPDAPTGACPTGQFNSGSLQDPRGNYCCSPIPCLGVGNGVVASPNLGSGICAPGSANFGLEDPQGNWCCSASPTVSYSVVRAGPAANGASSVFVENHALSFSTNADTLTSTITLPTATSGAQQAFLYQPVSEGLSKTMNDGALSLSVDGRYLTLAGYGNTTTGAVSSLFPDAAINPRVVALITATPVTPATSPPTYTYTVDTSTFFTFASTYTGVGGTGLIRSSATAGGCTPPNVTASCPLVGFWTSGTDGATGGQWFIPFGTAGGGTQIYNTHAMRVVNLFGGQLYADSDPSAGLAEMVTVGSGEPMTAGQTVSPLSGFTTLSDAGSGDVSAWAFAFAGPNTLYVATDQTGTGVPANGIQKWTLSGTTWSLQTTFNLATGQAIAGPVGFTGLTILATSAASTTFLATSETASPNFIVAFVDNGVYGSGGVTDTGTVIVQAPSGDMYEGLALTPH